MYQKPTKYVCKMHPKIAKYALKYTPIISVFDRKIFIQFRQRFLQENEVPNLRSAPKHQYLISFRKK